MLITSHAKNNIKDRHQGIPAPHQIQRGHNRQIIFASADDYLYYLDNLREWKEKLGYLVYAYCLMTNHVHLIIDPGHEEGNLARLMKRVSGRQTRYMNKLECRTGCLWEGRYKSSPISTDEYLYFLFSDMGERPRP